MPTYAYRCRACQRPFDALRRMEQRYSAVSPCCSALGDLDVAAGARTVQVQTFTPYREVNLKGAPLIESRAQRDQVLASHGATYDTAQYVQKHAPHNLESDALTQEILDTAHTAPPQSLPPMTAAEHQLLRSSTQV